ncbi:MAG: T9SS type A sorting domain-containing protein, partial [Flavobacteriales bacterium]
EPSGVDLNVNTSVYIRPNPTTTQWSISMQEPIRKWVLFDTRGREVASDDSGGASAFSVNAEELSPGVYIAQVESRSGNVTSIRLVRDNH